MPRVPHECKQTRRKINALFSRVPDRVAAGQMGAYASQLAADIRDHIQDVRKPDQIGCRTCHSIYRQSEQIHWGDEATHSGPVMKNRERHAS
jgi:hypothetical protein